LQTTELLSLEQYRIFAKIARTPTSHSPVGLPSNKQRLKHLRDSKFLIVGDIVHVLTTESLRPAFQSCNNGHENKDDHVISVITGFTAQRVVITLLHPISGIDIYWSNKNITQVIETALSA
jgi:hypothetical protein